MDRNFIKNIPYQRLVLFFAGITVFSVGISFYLWERVVIPALIQYLWEWFPLADVPHASPAISSAVTFNWLPTFVHVVSFSLLSLSAIRISFKRGYLTVGFWVSVNILFELGQFFWLPGTFDVYDILAALGAGGFVVALYNVLFVKYIDTSTSPTQNLQFFKRYRYSSAAGSTMGVIIIVLGITSISGSYVYCTGSNSDSEACTPDYDAEPVYMSYEELRNSAISTEQNVPLTESGKIYLYQHYLFVNSPNKGIHIYDNSDKQNPVYVTFINIPGNLDIAVKQERLYVDSFIDLVVLDISDINDIREIDRVEDVFPYDPYQNVPIDIWIGPLDSSKGVVIGYKEYDQNAAE